MQYTKLGNTGMDISRICLGCMGFGDTNWIHKWVLNENDSRAVVKHAIDQGVNFFDTANIYSFGASEEILGRALRDYAKRDEVVLGPKGESALRIAVPAAKDATAAQVTFRLAPGKPLKTKLVKAK